MSNNKNKHMGIALRKARKVKGLSQEQLADLVGISKQTISVYERGKIDIPEKNVISLAKALDIEPDTLKSGEKNPDTTEKNMKLAITLGMLTGAFAAFIPFGSILPATSLLTISAATLYKNIKNMEKQTFDGNYNDESLKEPNIVAELVTLFVSMSKEQRKTYLKTIPSFLGTASSIHQSDKDLDVIMTNIRTMIISACSMSNLSDDEKIEISEDTESLLGIYLRAEEVDKKRMLEALRNIRKTSIEN